MWFNLYPSCQHCNQYRKDRPLWGDLQYATPGGKRDQFPLKDESTRSLSPDDDLNRELRLLLDPCEDRPEESLHFTVDGGIVGIAGNQKGEVSVKVFHLDRRRLRKRRRKVIFATLFDLKAIRKFEAEQNLEAVREFRNHLETLLLADTCEYAAAARAVVRDPTAFGL